jgi:hypothetical protein
VGSKAGHTESLSVFDCIAVYDSFLQDYTWVVHLFLFWARE